MMVRAHESQKQAVEPIDILDYIKVFIIECYWHVQVTSRVGGVADAVKQDAALLLNYLVYKFDSVVGNPDADDTVDHTEFFIDELPPR